MRRENLVAIGYVAGSYDDIRLFRIDEVDRAEGFVLHLRDQTWDYGTCKGNKIGCLRSDITGSLHHERAGLIGVYDGTNWNHLYSLVQDIQTAKKAG